MNKVLDTFDKNIIYCTYCPKLCRFACPVTNAESRETVTPTTKMNFLQLVRDGKISLDADVADIFYRCAGCLACRAYCKHRIDVPAVIERARAEAVSRGTAPRRLDRHIATFKQHANPYGAALAQKLAAHGLQDRIDKTADTLYFIGCTTMFHDPETIDAVVRILDASGTDFAVHGDTGHLCCGTPALLSGARDDFKKSAADLAKLLNRYKTIVTNCPSCMAAFKYKYPDAGAPINARLVHITELAASLIKKGRVTLKEPGGRRAMYHDPCHLAKYFGNVEAPRRIMQALFQKENIIEFSWNRDKNYCCGGGGLLPITDPKTSREITRKRLEEFYEADADVLVTACPTCERTFRRADPYLRVEDLAALLAEHLK